MLYLSFASSVTASAGKYSIINKTLLIKHRVQVVSNPLNQFSITRIRRDISDSQFRGSVVLIAPLNFDVRFRELNQYVSLAVLRTRRHSMRGRWLRGSFFS